MYTVPVSNLGSSPYSLFSYDDIAALLTTYLVPFIIASAVLLAWGITINWRVFVRAGVAGWKSLIPIYDVITILKFLNSKKSSYIVFFLLLGISIAGPLMGLDLLTGLIILYYISLHFRIAKFFEKGTGFAIGAGLLWLIFGGILAFSKLIKTVAAPSRAIASEEPAETPKITLRPNPSRPQYAQPENTRKLITSNQPIVTRPEPKPLADPIKPAVPADQAPPEPETPPAPPSA